MAISNLPERRHEGSEFEGQIFADINVTPLVDIMLVLLIIFMVSSTIISEEAQSSGIKVDLPKAANKGGVVEQGDITVALTKEGQIVHEGEAIDIAQLKKLLGNAQAKNPKTVVIVQADREVQHGKVTEILDVARGLGLEHLAIATESAD